jgi:pilus assembly protein CpaE
LESRGYGGGSSIDYRQLVGELLREYIKPMGASEGKTRVGERERRKAGETDEEVAELAGGGTVIALFAAKAGIGKTTIAVNLAARLAGRKGTAVALVDGEAFGDVALSMDLPLGHTIADVGAHMAELDSESIKKYLVRHETGVAVLPAPRWPDWVNVRPGDVERVVGLLAKGHDYVLIDMPASFDESIGSTLRRADIVLLVTNMDVGRVKDAALALQFLDAVNVPKSRVKVVVNDNTLSWVRRQTVEDVLGRRAEWFIGREDNVHLSTQLGTPIVVRRPSARFCRVIREMAYAVSGTPKERQGLVARLTGRAGT